MKLCFTIYVIVLVCLGIVTSSNAASIIVDDDGGAWADYTSIQEAINNSSNGTSIFVYEGIYSENLKVNKSCILIGNGSNKSIINGSSDDYIIHVIHDDVTITGFTIVNGSGPNQAGIYVQYIDNVTISQSILSDNTYGILLTSTSHINISNNQILNNSYAGCGLINTNHVIITNNTVANNVDIGGIYLRNLGQNTTITNNVILNNSGTGIIMQIASANNRVFNNTIYRNGGHGIQFFDRAYNNTIYSNRIYNNDDAGIYCVKSSYNQLYNNTVWNNTYGIHCFFNSYNTTISSNQVELNSYGIIIQLNCVNSSVSQNWVENNTNEGIIIHNNVFHCTVTNNSIISNIYGIKLSSSHNNTISYNEIGWNSNYSIFSTESDDNIIYMNNIINNGGLLSQAYDDQSSNQWSYDDKGNYWSDYLGTDVNDDGIGDTPYYISGGLNTTDDYPLMDQVSTSAPSVPEYSLMIILLTLVLFTIYRKPKHLFL